MPFRNIIPTRLRVWLVRIMRWPAAARGWKNCAKERGAIADFPFVLSEHKTPLLRETGIAKKSGDSNLQDGKVRNLEVASKKINRVVVRSGEFFSYHGLVGWPGRLKGFRPGLELRNGELKAGIGGGCCALSNLLYLLAIRAGLDIVERHRHGLNMFPDHGRTVPFGCGATVFFPYADLKCRNPFEFPILIDVSIEDDTYLAGKILAAEKSDIQYVIKERDHRFEKRGDKWYRENRIVRIPLSATTGEPLGGEVEIATNRGLCLYDPEIAGETEE